MHNSGIARINLYKKYPDSLKLVHLLPAVFTLGVALLLLGTPFCLFSFTPIILYALLVCIDSTIQNKKSVYWRLFHCRRIYTAYRLWYRLLARMVAALYQREG